MNTPFSITKLSNEHYEKAREINTLISQRLLINKQAKICDITGVDKSKISRISQDVELISAILAILELKVVDKNSVYCSKGTAEATRELLKTAFESPEFMKILFHE